MSVCIFVCFLTTVITGVIVLNHESGNLRCEAPCCRPHTVCGHWPLLCRRPPIGLKKASPGLPLGPQDRPGDCAGPAQNKPDLGKDQRHQLLYSRNCCQEPLMINSSCPELHLLGRGLPLKTAILQRNHCNVATLHVINLLWATAPFLRSGYVNTNLSCLWLGFDLAVILAFCANILHWLFCVYAFDWTAFSLGDIFHLQLIHTRK